MSVIIELELSSLLVIFRPDSSVPGVLLVVLRISKAEFTAIACLLAPFGTAFPVLLGPLFLRLRKAGSALMRTQTIPVSHLS